MNRRSVRTRIKRMVPPISRRDDKLAAQTAELRALTKQLRQAERRVTASQVRLNEALAERRSLERASFQRALVDLRRTVVALRDIDPDKLHPLRQLPVKLANYRLAASHGVAVPVVHAVWPSIDAIDVTDLPDEFVLKSDRGAGARGVFPLSRVSETAFNIVNTERVVDQKTVKDELRKNTTLSGPFFAEELLKDAAGGRIPADIKVYAFYGRIGHVHLRSVAEHGNLNRTFSKFVDEIGKDLGDAVATSGLDPTIPLPADLPTVLAVSRHLSRAVGVSFIRVDLYETDRGVVLGELTRAPGGRHEYAEAHDEYLGGLLEEARWRLERDLMLGRAPGILHGPEPAPDLYPWSGTPEPIDPVDCEEWCRE